MKVVFFDYKKRDDVKCPYLVADIKELVEQYRQDKSVCFISAANSLLFMDGGSDLAYTKAISNIERKVKSSLTYLGLNSNCGRPYLPIGCSQMISPEGTYKFISAPSMFLPQKVDKTFNPYRTLRSALNLVKKYNDECLKNGQVDTIIETVYTPFMCTGWGGFTMDASYQMMMKAVDDYEGCSKDYDYIVKNNGDNFIRFNMYKNYKGITKEQPKIYMNTEFGITVEDVINNLGN